MAKKIVIIGGGVAGLSAGIYAKLNGFDAEIIEMHSITGGQCTAWDRKGFRFDYCLHWLVGTRLGSFNDIWKETNVINDKVEIIDHEVHTKIYNAEGYRLPDSQANGPYSISVKRREPVLRQNNFFLSGRSAGKPILFQLFLTFMRFCRAVHFYVRQ